MSEVLKQKAAEDAADVDACTSERTRLESEVRARLINEAAEKKAREDSARRARELEAGREVLGRPRTTSTCSFVAFALDLRGYGFNRGTRAGAVLHTVRYRWRETKRSIR